MGAKELDAIIASAALQVPPTYRLENYVINSGHSISATCHTPHGIECAWVTPELLKIMADYVPVEIKKIAEAMRVELTGKETNLEVMKGSLADALKGADVFIGVSAPGLVTPEMVKSMAKDPIIFACANPTPEIFPDEAKAAGAAVVSTGRSDFPNQINNVLAFPGIFRGTFDCMARTINEEMKIAAAEALAGLISDEELSADYIIPKAFDHRVGPAVAAAVAEAARRTGVARK